MIRFGWGLILLLGLSQAGCGSNNNQAPARDAARGEPTPVSLADTGGTPASELPGGCTLVAPAPRSCSNGTCAIPSGCFYMGSPASEQCRDADETWHAVTLSHGFFIAEHETTQDEFRAAMGYNPAKFSTCGGSCPVETVSWHEAAAYANALSSRQGLAACYACQGSGAAVSCTVAAAYAGAGIYSCPGFRLPTEAEWEYAYRAGTLTAFYDGGISTCWERDAAAERIGWYSQNASATTHPVGLKEANAWGLLDIAGNVEEWVHDGYGPYPSGPQTDQVLPIAPKRGHSWRGGNYLVYTKDLRAADRNVLDDRDAAEFIGFRVVRTR